MSFVMIAALKNASVYGLIISDGRLLNDKNTIIETWIISAIMDISYRLKMNTNAGERMNDARAIQRFTPCLPNSHTKLIQQTIKSGRTEHTVFWYNSTIRCYLCPLPFFPTADWACPLHWLSILAESKAATSAHMVMPRFHSPLLFEKNLSFSTYTTKFLHISAQSPLIFPITTVFGSDRHSLYYAFIVQNEIIIWEQAFVLWEWF